MKLKFIFLNLCFLALFANAQNSSIDKIKSFYDTFLNKVTGVSTGMFYMEYSVDIIPRTDEKAPTNSVTKIYKKNDRLYISSGTVDLWKIDEDFALIIQNNRSIHTGKNIKGSESDLYMQNMKRLLDFQNVLFSSPVSVTESFISKTEKKVVLIPRVEVTDVYKVKSVEFTYNTSTGNVTKMFMKYTDKHNLVSQEINYLTMNYNAKFTLLDGNPIRKIISESGKPLAKYAGYTVIDTTKD